MEKEMKERVRIYFAAHRAEIRLATEEFLVIDWRNENGSSEYYVRYIVDIQRGSLIVSGDLGDSIATWYNPVNPLDLARYVNDIRYYMGKFQCASDDYTYYYEDIEADLDGLRKEYVEDGFDEDDAEQDFGEMLEILEELNLSRDTSYPSCLTDLFEKYDVDWWEGRFTGIGERVNMRVYLWAVGYQMAVEQLGEQLFIYKKEKT